MKYRFESPQEKVMSFFHRGLTGLGVLVVLISVTQGINGIIGVVLMMALTSAFAGVIMWIARLLEGLFSRGRS